MIHAPVGLTAANSFGPGAADVTMNVVFYIGIVGLLGISAVAGWVIDNPPRRLLRGAMIAWSIAAAGATVIAIVRWSSVGGLAPLMASQLGRAAVVRLAALLLTHEAVLLAVFGRASVRTRALRITFVGASLSVIGHAMSSHAGGGGWSWLKMGEQALHVIAVGAWIGGLAALLLATFGEPDDAKAQAVRRFSRLAGFAIVIVAITGALRAFNEIGSLHHLAASTYGRLVIAKTNLLILLGILGNLNRMHHVERASTSLRGLRRVGVYELLVALVAITLTGVLSGTVPPASAVASPNGGRANGALRQTSVETLPGAVPIAIMKMADGRSIQAYFEPARAGSNELHVTFFAPSHAEDDIADVAIKLSPRGVGRVRPQIAVARRFGPGHFVATVVFSAATWDVRITATARTGVSLAGDFSQRIPARRS